MKKRFFPYFSFLIFLTSISGIITITIHQAIANNTGAVVYLTQAEGVNLENTLLKLPTPPGIQGKITPIFSANAYGQALVQSNCWAENLT